MMIQGRLFLLAVVFLCWLSVPGAPAQDGIYADFSTSMGSFTCRLDHALAPQAVANFVGLATGERAWLDLTSGEVKNTPFYDNQIFHRVIAGFMNQAGSPNGQGTDGPGYSFVDEFDPTLRHDSFGTLSSANSGPDSNGAQFFVTAGATPWLDDVHTVFGRLVGGSNVVYSINNVETGANDRPLTNVVLQSVTIRRVGAAAEAFDIHDQGLPAVRSLHARIARSGSGLGISFTNQLSVDNRLFRSTDLASWSHNQLGIETALPVTNTIHGSAGAAREFFRLAQVQYATPLVPPRNVFGRSLTIEFTEGRSGTLSIQFDATGGGGYTNNGSPGSLIGFNWRQEPYNGRLQPIAFEGSLDADMTMILNFDSTGAGTMTGTFYPAPYYYPNNPLAYPVKGTFTMP